MAADAPVRTNSTSAGNLGLRDRKGAVAGNPQEVTLQYFTPSLKTLLAHATHSDIARSEDRGKKKRRYRSERHHRCHQDQQELFVPLALIGAIHAKQFMST